MKPNKYWNIFGNIAMIASLIFISYKLSMTNIDLDILLRPNIVLTLIFDVLVYSSCMIFSAWVYFFLLKNLITHDISAKAVCLLYLEVNLYKYLPGNIFHFIGRNKIASNSKFSILNITAITLIEIVLQIITAFLIGVLFSARYFYEIINNFFEDNRSFLSVFVLLAMLGILLILYFGYKFINKRRKQSFSNIYKNSLPVIVATILFYFCIFFIFGAIFFSVLSLIESNISLRYAFPVIGVYTVSWLIGFLTPGVPGGIGIREVILSGFLSGLASQETIITISVINRIVSIVGDLISFLFFKLITMVLYNKQKGPEIR